MAEETQDNANTTTDTQAKPAAQDTGFGVLYAPDDDVPSDSVRRTDIDHAEEQVTDDAAKKANADHTEPEGKDDAEADDPDVKPGNFSKKLASMTQENGNLKRELAELKQTVADLAAGKKPAKSDDADEADDPDDDDFDIDDDDLIDGAAVKKLLGKQTKAMEKSMERMFAQIAEPLKAREREIHQQQFRQHFANEHPELAEDYDRLIEQAREIMGNGDKAWQYVVDNAKKAAGSKTSQKPRSKGDDDTRSNQTAGASSLTPRSANASTPAERPSTGKAFDLNRFPLTTPD